MKVDLHIHSKYSYDSIMKPELIIQWAKIKKLSVISITDHNSMDVYKRELKKEYLDRARGEYNVTIIKGAEIKTNFGDVIGLFLQEKISPGDFFEVIDKIKAQDGLILLPHPYRRNVDPENLIQYVDLVEVLNGRSSEYENKKAMELARKYEKPAISGSDAHIYWEIGKVYTELSHEDNVLTEDELRKILLESSRRIYGKPLPFYLTHGVSYITGRIKRKIRREEG